MENEYKFRQCPGDKNVQCNMSEDRCAGCPIAESAPRPMKMTNAEYIRSLDDKGLAAFLLRSMILMCLKSSAICADTPTQTNARRRAALQASAIRRHGGGCMTRRGRLQMRWRKKGGGY